MLPIERASFSSPWSTKLLGAFTGLGGWRRGQLVAYALTHGPDLLRLAVAPEARRRGWATHLLAALPEALVLHVLEGNRAAVELYVREGFRLVGVTGRGGLVLGRGDYDAALRRPHPGLQAEGVVDWRGLFNEVRR